MKNLIRTKEVEDAVGPLKNMFEWEEHCGSCDWFGDDERCPFYNIVKNNPDIYWEDIGCKNFWD